LTHQFSPDGVYRGSTWSSTNEPFRPSKSDNPAHSSRADQSEASAPDVIAVHFAGGPWDGQSVMVDRIVGPVFAVGHVIGNHYWLDARSSPPTYHWWGEPESA
jgi:hypothetical protein